jgi:glycogen operon protein
MLEWTRRVVDFRKNHRVLRRRTYFQGRPIRGAEIKDISWLRPDGEEMSEQEWDSESLRILGIWLAGAAVDLRDEQGNRVLGDTLVILMNSSDEPVEFRLPPTLEGRRWEFVLDTSRPDEAAGRHRRRGGRMYRVNGRSMTIFKHPTPAPP